MAKLLFIAPSAYTLGGVQVWLDYIVEGLSSVGHEVFVGLTSGRFHDVDSYLCVHPFRNVERVENPTGTAEGRIRSISCCIAKIQPDVVLAVNIADVYPAVARLKKEGMDVRAVMTLHGIQEDFLEDVHLYSNVLDGVVCTNRLVSSLLAETEIDKERIKYAPYGVDFVLPHNQKSFSANNPLRIAYVGRYDQEQKRVLDIPEIFRQLKAQDVQYTARFAGDGPLADELKLGIKADVDSGIVSFLGVLAPEDVANMIYDWADLLLVTSSWETGPIVIWESMSHGVPVVTSEYVGSIAEGSLFNAINCLMFSVGDCIGAAGRIIALKDSALRRTIIENGYRLVEEKYSRRASINFWTAAIDELLQMPLSKAFNLPNVPPNGRLDRALGVSFAESLRQLARTEFRHKSPGSEWPHSHSVAFKCEEFLAHVARSEASQFKSRKTDV